MQSEDCTKDKCKNHNCFGVATWEYNEKDADSPPGSKSAFEHAIIINSCHLFFGLLRTVPHPICLFVQITLKRNINVNQTQSVRLIRRAQSSYIIKKNIPNTSVAHSKGKRTSFQEPTMLLALRGKAKTNALSTIQRKASVASPPLIFGQIAKQE